MAAVIQTVEANGTGATVSATLTGVTAGNSLVAAVQYANNGPTTTVAGNIASSGDTWLLAFAQTNSPGLAGYAVAFFWVTSASAGTHVVTWTNPDTGPIQTIVLMETVPLTAVDQTASSNADATDAAASGTTGTTTQANELIFASLVLANTFSNVSMSSPATTGYTAADVGDPRNNSNYQTSWKEVSSTGTQVANWTWSLGVAKHVSRGIVTFKEAVAADTLFAQQCL